MCRPGLERPGLDGPEVRHDPDVAGGDLDERRRGAGDQDERADDGPRHAPEDVRRGDRLDVVAARCRAAERQHDPEHQAQAEDRETGEQDEEVDHGADLTGAGWTLPRPRIRCRPHPASVGRGPSVEVAIRPG